MVMIVVDHPTVIIYAAADELTFIGAGNDRRHLADKSIHPATA